MMVSMSWKVFHSFSNIALRKEIAVHCVAAWPAFDSRRHPKTGRTPSVKLGHLRVVFP